MHRVCSQKLYCCVQSILMSAAAAVECVERACEQIQDSRHLAEVLRAVLATGNMLNAGTHRGQAVGIKLESLTKLADVKARTLWLHWSTSDVTKRTCMVSQRTLAGIVI